MKNENTCKIKTGYYLELLMPEMMKLFSSTKTKTKHENKMVKTKLNMKMVKICLM